MKALPLLLLLLWFTGCSTQKEGRPLAVFALETLKGKTVSNEHLRDKVTVINIWGTWCGPCVGEIPHLNALVEKYSDAKDVVFIALAKEDKAKIERFVQRRPFNYVQIPNAEVLTDELHTGLVDEIPLHVIVDKQGIIRFEMVGTQSDIGEILSAEIDKLR